MSIQQPADQKITSGNLEGKLKWKSNFGKQKSEDFIKAQKFVDNECIKHMEPLTPWMKGNMHGSAITNTKIGSGEIQYGVPYDRRQYYEHKGNGQRGSKWFERMKTAHKEDILRGAQQIV